MTEFRKDCMFCDTNGDLQILPLRYAVIGADETKSVSMLPALSGTLGKDVTSIALGIPNARYAVRPLRCGYLYVLIERKGKKKWQGYAVSKGGELYRFDPEGDKGAPAIQPFVCDQSAHGIHASFVHIPDSKDVSRIWLLFMPDPATKSSLKTLRDCDALDNSSMMQVFRPADWKKGNTQQQHTLKPEQIETTVAEMLAENVEPLRDAINHSLFPTYEEMEANIPLNLESFRKHTSHLENLQLRLQQLGGLAFVLHDAIGITQELNDFRNAPLARLKKWLDEKKRKGDGFNSDGLTNEYRVDVLNAIDDVRAALQDTTRKDPDIQKMVKEEEKKFFEGWHRYTRAFEGTFVPPRGKRGNPADEAKFQEEMDEKFYDRWWSEHCEGKGKLHSGWIDGRFLKSFRKKYMEKLDWCDATIRHRYAGHLNWVKSLELQKAFFAYDQSAPEGSIAGLQFAAQVGLAIVGMTYTKQGAALIDTWAKDFGINEGNLLMRAFCYNQTDIRIAMTAALKVAMTAPDMEDEDAYRRFVSDELYGFPKTLPDDESTTAWFAGASLKIGGQVAKLFDKVTKVMGESANQAWIKEFPMLGKTLIGPATLCQRILGFQMKPGEEKVVKALLAVQIAPLAREMGKVHDARTPYPNKPAQAAAQTAATYTQGAKVMQRESLYKWQDIYRTDPAKPASNDYMRIRTASVIMFFEAANLFVQARKSVNEGKVKLTLVAAALACVAVGGELYAYGYRTISRVGVSVVAQRGGSVAYGKVKLWTGAFSFAAGIIGAGLDIEHAIKAWGRKENGLAFVLAMRGIAQGTIALMGIGTSIADTVALFTFLAQTAKRPLMAWSFGQAAKFASALNGMKPAMYRIAAWGTWVTLVITAGMYSYECLFPDALQEWCKKSCFRNHTRTGPYFKDQIEERNALYSAFKAVMGGEEEETPKNLQQPSSI